MKSGNIIFRNICISLCAIFFCAINTIGFRTEIFNRKTHIFKQMPSAPISAGNECEILMEIPIRSDGIKNCWYHDESKMWGAQYDIYIKNNSDARFTDWILKISLPFNFRIDSSWNGNFTEIKNENSIVVTGTNEALNTNISSNEKGKIGFVLYTPELLETCSFELTYRLKRSLIKNPLFIVSLILFIISVIMISTYYIVEYLLKKQKKESSKTITALIKVISNFIDTRDSYTKEHSLHVAKYSRMIAQKLGFDNDALENIYYLGLLHDVGKVLIPNEILRKPGKLNDEEWAEMKKHTIYGADVLQDFKEIPEVKNAVLYHHERYDGKGYMSELAGNNIPLVARIIGVADAYDAMATDRAYRKALSQDKIISELEENCGGQFDPRIASIMIDLIKSGAIKN